MRRLIQRYLLTIENPNKPFQSHAPQLTAERLGDCGELKDMIAQLQGMLRRSEERKGLADAAKPQSEVSAYQETKIFLGCSIRDHTQTRTTTGTSSPVNKSFY